MNQIDAALRVSAANNPKHNGGSHRIRCALRDNGGWMSIDAICMATGLKRVQVRSSVTQMMGAGGSGGILSIREHGVVLYSVYRAPAPKAEPVAGEEFKIAGRITYPNYRYGSSRLG